MATPARQEIYVVIDERKPLALPALSNAAEPVEMTAVRQGIARYAGSRSSRSKVIKNYLLSEQAYHLN